jgi:hypothetical protein
MTMKKILIITILAAIGILVLYCKQRENFDYFLNAPGSCIDNKNSVPVTNTLMFYPKIEDSKIIKYSDKPSAHLTHVFMGVNNEGNKYNDGIVYNSMYYTDNTFENTVQGGIRYTQMMPKNGGSSCS